MRREKCKVRSVKWKGERVKRGFLKNAELTT